MAVMPEPTPNALGQAEAPNAMLPAVAPVATGGAMPEGFVKDRAKAKPVKPNYSMPGDELLFGPTERPDDLMSKVRPSKFVKAPSNLEQYMPAFTEAARQPDAPKELLEFMRILNFHMGRA